MLSCIRSNLLHPQGPKHLRSLQSCWKLIFGFPQSRFYVIPCPGSVRHVASPNKRSANVNNDEKIFGLSSMKRKALQTKNTPEIDRQHTHTHLSIYATLLCNSCLCNSCPSMQLFLDQSLSTFFGGRVSNWTWNPLILLTGWPMTLGASCLVFYACAGNWTQVLVCSNSWAIYIYPYF